MDRQNFYAEQLVGVVEMMNLQLNNESALKGFLKALVAQGIIDGMGVTPTIPAPSLVVVIGQGHIGNDAGAIVQVPNPLNVDLSGVAPIVTPGNSRWVTITATSILTSDTPVVPPAGGVIQYHTFDNIQIQITVGDEALNPVKPDYQLIGGPAIAHPITGLIIADIKQTYALAAYTADKIDVSRAALWTSIPKLLNLIATHQSHIADVIGLQAALDGKASLAHTHNMADVIGLIAALAGKLDTTLLDSQGPKAAVAGVNGAWVTLFTKFIPGGTIQAGKGLRLNIAWARNVGLNRYFFGLRFNNVLVNAATNPADPTTGLVPLNNVWHDTIEYMIMNNAAHQDQQHWMYKSELNSTIDTGQTSSGGAGVSNIDFTLDQTATFDIWMPNTDQAIPEHWTVEHIR